MENMRQRQRHVYKHQFGESLALWLRIQYLCAFESWCCVHAPNELNLMLISVNYEFRNVSIEWHSGRVEHDASYMTFSLFHRQGKRSTDEL